MKNNDSIYACNSVFSFVVAMLVLVGHHISMTLDARLRHQSATLFVIWLLFVTVH